MSPVALAGHERYTAAMKLFPTLLSAVLAWTCASALAQWQWIDKDGRKVFSDRAPPPDVLEKNILKRPANRGPSNAAADSAVSDTPAAAPALPLASKDRGVDKELEAKKKQAAEAEVAKRKAEEERQTKAKIENCANAKQAKVTYDSGMRVARTNANGEREYLDDAARASELKRIQAVINTDCQ